jgi:predicted dehydrogenase
MAGHPLRIGLVGAGAIGTVHSIVLRELARAWPERIELVAVADPVTDVRDRVAAKYGYGRTFADAGALLAEAPVDALFVCTPTRFHAEIVHAAAARGVHLFCEKPLAMSHAEACDILTAVRRAGVSAQIGLVLRFSAVYWVMRDLLAGPEVGEPMAVWFRDDQCFPIRGLHDTPWRGDRTLTAGGTLIEHGVHDLDLLTWLFGPIARVRAIEQNRAAVAGVEDYVAVDVEHASGLRAQLLNVWHDMAGRPSNRRLEIFCRRAFVASDHDMLGDIELQEGDSALARLSPDEVLARFERLLGDRDHSFRHWYGLPYFLQDLSFIESLLAGRAPGPGLEVGVEAQRIAELVYRAARSGEAVDVGAGESESAVR